MQCISDSLSHTSNSRDGTKYNDRTAVNFISVNFFLDVMIQNLKFNINHISRGIHVGTSIFPTSGCPVGHHFPHSTPFNQISLIDLFALAGSCYGDHSTRHRPLANHQPYSAPMQMVPPWATICIGLSYGPSADLTHTRPMSATPPL